MTGVREADLELTAGGRRLRFPAIWLRDNCPCPECRDPGSGQKLKDITEIPNDVGVAASADAGESVRVTFAPDGHRSTFSRSWLAGHALDGYAESDGRTEDDKEFWLAADLPQVSWPRYLDRPADRSRALEHVLRRGFVLLHDVPPEPGMVLEVAASFGFVRETELLAQPERQLNLRLAAGDCLVFDNTRMLHARTAFGLTAGSPGRHLQGCYADMDGLASTLAVLRRQEHR